MERNTRKVVIFIVEGPTDEMALGPIFKRIFQEKFVHFRVVHGDLTATRGITGTTVVNAVYSAIKEEMKLYGLKKQDVVHVIHLVDTDGVFIPEGDVRLKRVEKIQYEATAILSSYPEFVIERNKRKSSVLKRLSSLNQVGGIPYHIYYFSRNLEHVLHGDCKGLSTEHKVEYADAFADRFKDHEQEFRMFLLKSEFHVEGAYEETWDFIMEGLNSLHRHCNLHMLLKEEAVPLNH